MVGLLSENIVVAKLNNFAQSYRPRYLEERIRRSHTKQLEQQLDQVGRSRRSLSMRGKSEASDSLNANSASNSPRKPDGETSLAPILQELAEQLTDHHKPTSNTTSPNKENTATSSEPMKASAGHTMDNLQVTAHHIQPEIRTTSEGGGGGGGAHALHHSPSGHHRAEDLHGHGVEHHHHHHGPVSVLQKSLSNIVFDANLETGDAAHGAAAMTKVDEASVNEILVLGKQLAMTHTGSNSELNSPSNVAGGRKGAEIQKAIQQDQELEKGIHGTA